MGGRFGEAAQAPFWPGARAAKKNPVKGRRPATPPKVRATACVLRVRR
jgi:hypothetical protein